METKEKSTENIVTFKEKLILQKNIKKLRENEHMEILRILIDNNIKFTENNNGVFFNLKTLKNDVIVKINIFVNFCMKNKDFFDNKNKTYEKIIVKKNNHKNLDNNYKKYLSNETSITRIFTDTIPKKNEKSIINGKKDLQKKIKTNVKKNIKIKMIGVKGRIINKCKNLTKNEVVNESIDSNEIDDTDLF